MSATEAIATLRALKYLKSDLQLIAGGTAEETGAADTSEEIADRVEAVFSATDKVTPGDRLDEPREMLADVKRAWQRVNELQVVISEAITHAQNAGEKYESVISDLADVNGDLETTAAALDAVMAIDPDNYEPKESTEAEKAVQFVQRSLDVLTDGKELLDDALDHATHSGFKPLVRRVSTARELTIKAANYIAELTKEINAMTEENEQ